MINPALHEHVFQDLDDTEAIAADVLYRYITQLGAVLSPLSALKVYAHMQKWTDERGHVIAARRAGHTWQEIGDALGMSRQGAWQSFSDVDTVHDTGNPEGPALSD